MRIRLLGLSVVLGVIAGGCGNDHNPPVENSAPVTQEEIVMPPAPPAPQPATEVPEIPPAPVEVTPAVTETKRESFVVEALSDARVSKDVAATRYVSCVVALDTSKIVGSSDVLYIQLGFDEPWNYYAWCLPIKRDDKIEIERVTMSDGTSSFQWHKLVVRKGL